jgi:chemotaxis protein CheD
METPVRHVVGVADMKIAAGPGETLVTYALGSCLGVTVYDPVARVGGLLHVMLPDSSSRTPGTPLNPYKFVDTGLPLLFKQSYQAGARKERLVVKVAGGASSKEREADDMFQIGKRNFLALKKLLWKNGVLIAAHEVGGSVSRTVTLETASGEVLVKSNGQTAAL